MIDKTLSVLALALTMGVNLQAQDSDPGNQKNDTITRLEEVVVSDTRFPIKRENSGKTVIRISRNELESMAGQSVAQVINTQSGIEINGVRSNAGQNLSYFIRGGNNRQVLVMIDGIQMTDPSQIANDFDLRLLDVNMIENMEIIKGAASTLYGNAAAAAVINITTRKAGKEGMSLQLNSSMGTNKASGDKEYGVDDFRNSVILTGSTGRLRAVAGFSQQYTDGLSAVAGEESDVFNRYNSNFRISYRFSDHFSLSGTGSHDHFEAGFDRSVPREDADFLSESTQNRLMISPEYRYDQGSVKLNLGFNEISRELTSDFPAEYYGRNLVLDLFQKHEWSDSFYTIAGVNHINSKAVFSDDTSFSITDPYLNLVWLSSFGLNLNSGARLNNHSEYGSTLTYNLNPSYRISMPEGGYLKFLSSYSTSYIAPSLTQLFGPFGANPDLQPEENTTFEAGAELLRGSFRFSSVYFHRLEENFINYQVFDFDTFEGGFVNVEEDFNVRGVEVEMNWNPLSAVRLDANYTFTENPDRLALRIPKHKANVFLNYAFASKKGNIRLGYQFTGARTDTDFETFENVTLEAFSLVGIGGSYRINDHLSANVQLENLFDEEYFELVGYETRGRNIRLGFSLNL
ncbi:TonB-dependent receptor plug domain-containing protein [Robertkochia aurantiaca]|uniref:TonB-dependent receptor plug domain-containing protein n=1 Tax=Robertkochia aurantiaca TaxID=2873700 RepID=UPI001CCFFBC1|nr:TonB-dependent receptor [Robertkochia sp. 3YJGBD-33]